MTERCGHGGEATLASWVLAAYKGAAATAQCLSRWLGVRKSAPRRQGRITASLWRLMGPCGPGGLNVEEDAAEEATASPRPVAGVTDVVAVAAGKFHSLALRRDGMVWAWGSNYFGQLGNGHTESRSTPLPVDNLEDVMDIAAASLHNLAVRRDGTVWAWGADELRDLVGDDDLVPAQVPALHDVAMVATGDNHAIALTGAGTVKTWGWNNFGQLGNGEEGTHYYLPQDD